MLEIVRGRAWSQFHTVLDSTTVNDAGEYIDFADLSEHTNFKSQIRAKSGIKVGSVFSHPLIANVTLTLSGTNDSIIRQSLTREQTLLLVPGQYMVDIMAVIDGIDENIMEPELILVTDRPTTPD